MRDFSGAFLVLLLFSATTTTSVVGRRLGGRHQSDRASFQWEGLPDLPPQNIIEHATLTDLHKKIPVYEQPCPCVSNGLPVKVGSDGYGHIAYKPAGSNDTQRELPVNYGEMCKAWEEDTDPACASEFPPGYCHQKWCYVAKDCEAKDTKKSLFFPGEDNLYYSYVNCGSFDGFTANACTQTESEGDCKEPCAWNGDHGCQNALCQCTGANEELGEVELKTFGNDYGKTCKAWDAELCEHWTEESELGLWCCKSWCYVDESCPSAKKSALHDKLFYSYHTCPDKVEKMLECPHKEPVDFEGEPIPLSSQAAAALEKQAKKEKEVKAKAKKTEVAKGGASSIVVAKGMIVGLGSVLLARMG